MEIYSGMEDVNQLNITMSYIRDPSCAIHKGPADAMVAYRVSMHCICSSKVACSSRASDFLNFFFHSPPHFILNIVDAYYMLRDLLRCIHSHIPFLRRKGGILAPIHHLACQPTRIHGLRTMNSFVAESVNAGFYYS